ncbi:hypothetical protein HPB47_004584 [Ixodes persulcatus]|uniref:Uncharacterized protein n=1 Tax=Ixodes persulcatus TaxID=34615 RepID=A0AC60PG82_IXOPE|nr:hypothetical protein HPB47_004584 [Ixodes persulcatus]
MTAPQAQRGYDPEAMAWTTVSVNPIEEPPPGESLRHENLSKLGERRSRRRVKMARLLQPSITASSAQRSLRAAPLLSQNRKVFQCGELGEALNALLGEAAAAALTLLPSLEQNLIVTGTPHADVADRLLGDFQLASPKGSILMRGNLKQTDNVCKGVITVANHETTASLQHKIISRAGKIVDIRKYGTSNAAQLTFDGQTGPRYVHYNSEVALCGTVGHRADTCPNRNGENCGLCGQKVSVVEGVRACHETGRGQTGLTRTKLPSGSWESRPVTGFRRRRVFSESVIGEEGEGRYLPGAGKKRRECERRSGRGPRGQRQVFVEKRGATWATVATSGIVNSSATAGVNDLIITQPLMTVSLSVHHVDSLTQPTPPGHSGVVTKDGAPRQADLTETKQRAPPAGSDIKGQQAPPPPPHGAK